MGVEHRSESEALRFQAAIDSLRRDTQFLVQLSGVRGLSENEGASDPEGERISELARARLTEIFVHLIETRRHYAQIRFISFEKQGPELVRIERRQGRGHIVPRSELQTKGHRDYVKLGAEQESGMVLLHSPSLNREHGALVVPHQAMLRATGTYLGRDGKSGGLVVINMDLGEYFSSLEAQQGGRHSYVTNELGDFLLHPVSTRAFGCDFGRRYLAQGEFDGFREWLQDEGGEARFLTRKDGEGSVAFRRLWLDTEHTRFLTLGVGAEDRVLGKRSLRIALIAGILALALMALALALAYGMARRTTRPLEAMAETAKQVQRGEAPHPLLVERSDEVGTLARAFSAMLASQSERQAAVSDLNKRLRQTNLDLEHFAQIASHDLREPARRVALMADFLLEDEAGNFTQEGKETTERMREAAEKLLVQITEIRSLTQVGEGRLIREQTELSALVNSCLMRVEDQCTARGVLIRCESLPRLPVYENLLRVLYAKLIENALEHSSGDGLSLLFDAEFDQGCWVLGVRNDRSSIGPDELEKVFRPLTSRDAFEGKGMGLSICRRIVERHAGRIWAESGTDFVHIKFTLGGSYESESGPTSES